MTPREIALSICEPWFNDDPCEGCECHKVCTKLVERIEAAIQADRSADTGKTSDHIGDASKMVASVRENRTVEPVANCEEAGHSEGRCGNASCITPPKREPLTDEEIKTALCSAYHGKALTRYDIKIARAIERAHGIGGEE